MNRQAQRLAPWLIVLSLWLFTLSAHAGCLDQPRLQGVNLAGAEFGSKQLPGILNKDYIYPRREDLVYFQQAGMNTIRLPFLWERIQRTPYAALNTGELAQISQVVTWARELDLCLLLDLHNYGRYRGQALGSEALPESALLDVWQRLAQAFNDPNRVALGLMNEPAAVAASDWPDIAQRTLLALRNSGATHLMMVPAPRWSGAHEWHKRMGSHTPAEAFEAFFDPLDRYAIELHQYADANFSGTHTECIEAERISKIMDAASQWGRSQHKRFFLGEFGVAANPQCLQTLTALLEGMQDQQVWLGWTYWAAGAWWGKYPLSIQPSDKQDNKRAYELIKAIIKN